MRLIRTSIFFLSLVAKAVAQVPAVDVQHYGFSLFLSDSTNHIEGRADVTVRFLSASSVLHLDLVPPGAKDSGMRVRTVTEGGRAVVFIRDRTGLSLRVRARAGSLHTYRVSYGGIPADGLIISTNKFGHRAFFGDNWPDRAHQWLPCIDRPADKAAVDFTVTAPAHYQVVAPGVKIEEVSLSRHRRRTHWRERVPLPTKVMVIGVADFAVSPPDSVLGIPLYTYVFPENKEQGFRDYAVAARILPYYIRRIGPYAYEKLANVQSKTIFGGMENASAIFYFENSVGSRGMEELMAHEIAHQWFGDAVTETDYQHLWLSEGFATYMTHLYMEDRYGADTLRKGMAADRKKVLALALRHPSPVVDTAVHGGYMRLLNANSYQKGGWVLHMLRRELGDSVFWEGIRRYFARYDGHNASTESFRAVMEEVSGRDLGPYFTQWLYTPGVPEIKVTWASADGGAWDLRVEQVQPQLYAFPLEYSMGADSTGANAAGGALHTLRITDRVTLVRLPAGVAPRDVRIDPDVNLLADIKITLPS